MNHVSQSRLAARTTLAAAFALALGTAAAVAQTSGTSSPSGTRADDSTYNRQTNASTSGAAAGSYETQTDSTRRSDVKRRDRAAAGSYDTADSTRATGSVAGGDHTMRDKLSFGDRRFVTKTADSGQSEVALAQLAAERASNPEVKSFAERLVKDHTMVNEELTSLASTKNVKLDAEDDKDRHYKRMAKKSGSDFDEEFLEHMVDSHENSVKNFEKASREAKDAEVRAFASKHLEHLRGHLQMAQNLRSSVMPTGRDTTDETPGAARTDAGTSSSTATGTSQTPASDYDSGTTKSRSGTDTDTDTSPRSDNSSDTPRRNN